MEQEELPAASMLASVLAHLAPPRGPPRPAAPAAAGAADQEPPFPAQVADVNTTDIRAAVALACSAMANGFDSPRAVEPSRGRPQYVS